MSILRRGLFSCGPGRSYGTSNSEELRLYFERRGNASLADARHGSPFDPPSADAGNTVSESRHAPSDLAGFRQLELPTFSVCINRFQRHSHAVLITIPAAYPYSTADD